MKVKGTLFIDFTSKPSSNQSKTEQILLAKLVNEKNKIPFIKNETRVINKI